MYFSTRTKIQLSVNKFQKFIEATKTLKKIKQKRSLITSDPLLLPKYCSLEIDLALAKRFVASPPAVDPLVFD